MPRWEPGGSESPVRRLMVLLLVTSLITSVKVCKSLSRANPDSQCRHEHAMATSWSSGGDAALKAYFSLRLAMLKDFKTHRKLNI